MNVVVSAILRSGGIPDAVLKLCLAGQVQAYASGPILSEYEEVLSRPRLAVDPEDVSTAMATIRASASLKRPAVRVTAALDPDDNMFLECAEAAMRSIW